MSYLLRRAAAGAWVLLAVSLIAFSLGALASGDPAEEALRRGGGEATSEAIATLRAQLGLDRPGPVRYATWLVDALRGDLGRSYRNGAPVAAELAGRLGASLLLASSGLILAAAIGLSVGITAAIRPAGVAARACRALTLLGASLPSYWLGLLLIQLFAVGLQALPSSGSGTPAHLLLPTLALAARPAAALARLSRDALLDQLRLDYVLAARARGLRNPAVLIHALRNGLLPVVTFAGLSFGRLLGGVALVETVFGWPGLGRLMVEAAYDRDTPLIQGFVLLVAAVYLTANVVVDCCYRRLDPRIRLGAAAHG